MSEVLVNVLVITYNHEKYIERAIKSILNQKTNFRFNIIIGEDNSTDLTREKLLKLSDENPSKLKLLLQETNIGARKNLKLVEENCDAPYIAILEGDDYWVDDSKLQKQIDFLENNEEFSACVHGINIVDKNDNLIVGTYHENMYYEGTKYTKKQLNKGILPGQSGTMVYRNILSTLKKDQIDKYYSTNSNGDWRRTVLLLSNGPIYCFKEKMSNYRYVISGGSSWNSRIYGKNFADSFFDSFTELEYLTTCIYYEGLNFEEPKENMGHGALKFLLKSPNKENYRKFIYVYSKLTNKKKFWKNLVKKIIRKK